MAHSPSSGTRHSRKVSAHNLLLSQTLKLNVHSCGVVRCGAWLRQCSSAVGCTCAAALRHGSPAPASVGRRSMALPRNGSNSGGASSGAASHVVLSIVTVSGSGGSSAPNNTACAPSSLRALGAPGRSEHRACGGDVAADMHIPTQELHVITQPRQDQPVGSAAVAAGCVLRRHRRHCCGKGIASQRGIASLRTTRHKAQGLHTIDVVLYSDAMASRSCAPLRTAGRPGVAPPFC